MGSRRRFEILSAFLALVATTALSACGGSGALQARPSPGSTGAPQFLPSASQSRPLPSGIPKCQFPDRIGMPAWMPSDLPLPADTYATQAYPDSFGYSRGLFVVPGSLVDLARFVLGEWPKAGWVLGRGDSEQSEIEDEFSKPPSVGAFKAQSQFCAPGYNLMLVIFAKDRSKIGPTPPGTQGGSPLVPSSSPSR